jgi:hypothetical protein
MESLSFGDAVRHRGEKVTSPKKTSTINTQSWLALAVEHMEINEDSRVAARLDVAILHQRLT